MTQLMDPPANAPARTTGNGNDRQIQLAPPRLPYHPLIEERFGVDKASWKALVEAIFPAAQSVESIILALSYCRARKLDPFKKNVHIVPIWDSKRKCLVDTIWPGIGELRTTAFRTSEYAGRDQAEFGPVIERKVGSLNMTFPEWCRVTVYRLIRGQRVSFSGPAVYWLETYSTRKHDDDTPNEMWATRPRGQLEKCAEAAALRAAFPEEIGTDYIAEEARGSSAGPAAMERPPVPRAHALLAKVTSRPVSEDQTFEPTPEAQQEAAAAEVIDQAPEPDASGADAEPPAEEHVGKLEAIKIRLSEWLDADDWQSKLAKETAANRNTDPSVTAAGIKKWANRFRDGVPLQRRVELAMAIDAGVFEYDTGLIKK